MWFLERISSSSRKCWCPNIFSKKSPKLSKTDFFFGWDVALPRYWGQQLDWASCADAQNINFPRDQEGYDKFESICEKLSSRRIHWCRTQMYMFFFGELFLKIDENDLFLPRRVGCASSKALIRRSQVLLRCVCDWPPAVWDAKIPPYLKFCLLGC